MNEPGPTSVGELLTLLEAADLLLLDAPDAFSEDEWKTATITWRSSFRELVESLTTRRSSLHGKVMQALGEASMCWEPKPTGVFDSEHAAKVGEKLMSVFDQYCDLLPAVRQANMLSLEQQDPAERLAAAIYEISAQVGAGMPGDKWDDAQPNIKRVLTETANQLLESKIIAPGMYSAKRPEEEVPPAPKAPPEDPNAMHYHPSLRRLDHKRSECRFENCGKVPVPVEVKLHAVDD
jgi:hypothetical protein